MTTVTRAVHAANIASKFADNTARAITPLMQREVATDELDSSAYRVVGTASPGSAPEAEGDIAVNTTADTAFVSVGTSSASDWEQLAFLSSLAGTGGAALIGVEDAAGDYTATTVEGILAEIAPQLGGGGGGGLTENEAKAAVGEMVVGNSETLISVTYQSGDRTLDFTVDNDLSNYDNSTSGFLASGDIGTTVQGYDADILKSDTTDDLTAGYTSTSLDIGTQTTGTLTPDPTTRNKQRYTNGGAHTLSPPSVDCDMQVKIINNGSAGTITTSGFTALKGDSLTTTSGHKFMCTISVNDGDSVLSVAAMQ